MKSAHPRRFPRLGVAALLLWSFLLVRPVAAEEIVGVQPASLDQPRIYLNLRKAPRDEPLSTTVGDLSASAVEAFLDTGSSGIVLSGQTADALKITRATTAEGQNVVFEDVGVGGMEKFHVSEPLYVSFAPYSSNTDGENQSAYGPVLGPGRAVIRPRAGLLERLMGGLDIAGMPAIKGKVIVIDARPLAQFDKLRTSLVPPGDASIPKTNRHVPLTMVSFTRFTRLVPPDAPGPALTPSPVVGPDPLKAGDARPAVVARHGGKEAKLSMLLDTGAAASMISRKTAEALGVRYSDDERKLIGVPEAEQFSLTIGGIGGQKTARGFYLDQLALPTTEGEPVVYGKAPVLVMDISVTDPQTKKLFTLDGILGMNFLVASAKISGGLMPDIEQITDGAFTHIVIDEPRGILGLKDR